MSSTALVRSIGRRATRAPLFSLFYALWLASMVSIPILRWTLGDRILPVGVSATVILQTATTLAALTAAWPISKMLRTALTVVLFAWLLEWIGSTTGIPFGRYVYTELLQPQVGHVPLLIPVAWLMMLPASWAIAQCIVGKSRGALFAAVSALAFTAWDFFLDPQMVGWNLWVWQQPGGYFGIPWINFGGWAFGALLITLLARPGRVPIAPLVAIYVTTWLLQFVGQLFFWQLPGPALTGGIAMGAFAVSCLRKRGGRS